MANKEILARVKNKRDTSSNWTQNNPVLLNGEIILVDTAEGELRAKIGDGVKTYTQLPFSDEALRSLINNNKVTVDDALSSTSTNPVQNKVVNTAISNLSTLVGDTSVASQITAAIANKADSDHTHDVATTSADGFMSSTDKTKLDGIAEGAEVNVQSNWMEKDSSNDAYIKNKPFIRAGAGTGSIILNKSIDITGGGNTADGHYSVAEGWETTASGLYSHAEGGHSSATAERAHAEGYSTASGVISHSEGELTVASGRDSHAEGLYTIAAKTAQHVEGRYNIEDTGRHSSSNGSYEYGSYIHIAGNGTAEDARSNAHTLDWDGNAWFAGDIKIGGTGYSDSAAKAIATQEYVNNSHPTVDDALSSTSTNAVQNKVVNTAISNLNTLVGDTAVSTQINEAIKDKANTSDLTSHTSNKSNPHEVTKAQVGLGNVTNDAQVKRTEMGAASGVATLDANKKVPVKQLPTANAETYGIIRTAKITDSGVSGMSDSAVTLECVNYMSDNVLMPMIESKADSSNLTSHTGNTTVHITAEERTKWNNVATTASSVSSLVGDTAVSTQISNAVEPKLDKDDAAWTQIYDSGAITTAVNAISGINVSGYKSLKVAIKCVNTTANSATAGGAIVFTCENGQDYVFANILGNLIRNTASTSGGAADFKVLDNYLACECSYRALNAENMLSDEEGAGADNLTTLCGGCYIKCTSPISTMMITNATQSDSLYYGVGSRVVVWGCKV